MTVEQATSKGNWRPKFSLLTLVLGVVFVGACGGLWWRWEPWGRDHVLEYCSHAEFSPDGRWVLTSVWNGTTRIRNAETGREHVVFAEDSAGSESAVYSPNGRLVVTVGSSDTAHVWDAETGRKSSDLRGHTEFVFSAAFSPDGRRIATGAYDRTARVWSTEDCREQAVLKGHTDLVRSVAFSPDGRWIVTTGEDDTTRVWDAQTGRERTPSPLLRSSGGAVYTASFSPDGLRIVVADEDGIHVLEAETGRECFLIKGEFHSASFSPNGQRIASGGVDCTGRVWDATTGRELAVLKGHAEPVGNVAFSPDGQRVVTCSGFEAWVWTRQRPEQWWGIAWLPEFWIAYFSGGALLVIAARRLRARKAVKQEAA